MTKESLLAAVLELDTQSRQEVYEALRESLERDPDAFRLTEEQIAVIERRLAEHRANPEARQGLERSKSRDLECGPEKLRGAE